MQFIRRLVALAGILATMGAAAGIAAHYTGVTSSTATRLAAFTPLLIAGGLVAVPLLAVARYRLLTIVAVIVAAVGVWSQVPLFTATTATRADSGAVTVRVMQANIRLGEADAQALVRTATAEHVDVLTVIELTPDAVARLAAAGLARALPYSFLRPRQGGGGAGIYSRFPLSEGVQLPGVQHNNLQAVAAVPGAGATAVYALHPLPPYPEPADQWVYELRRLRGIFAEEARPLLVGADFNSTYDHRQYRDLLRNSSVDEQHRLVDATEYLGAGIVATYPADRPYPALLAIDKILTRGGTPVSLRRIDLPGSDHHGLIGDIRFPAAPTSR